MPENPYKSPEAEGAKRLVSKRKALWIGPMLSGLGVAVVLGSVSAARLGYIAATPTWLVGAGGLAILIGILIAGRAR